MAAAEREHVLRALAATGWRRGKAAQFLGITTRALFDKMRRHHIVRP
jgi:transcriptional regulator with GAF, ATPase, and Fis domain